MENKKYISDELLAAYLDGNASKEETELILQAMKSDDSLRETLDIALQVEMRPSMPSYRNYRCCRKQLLVVRISVQFFVKSLFFIVVDCLMMRKGF